jgi:hypothetical protein
MLDKCNKIAYNGIKDKERKEVNKNGKNRNDG